MTAETLDMDHLATWLGRGEKVEDVLTHRLVSEYEAAVAPHGFSPEGCAPLGIHWCLAPMTVPADKLGPDGHPDRGGFMPPVPLKRRMWAGGEVTMVSPLKAGDRVTRQSEITGITRKDGKSGPMVFVTVMHEYFTERGLAIRDRQDAVYLNPVEKPQGVADANKAPQADHTEAVDINPTFLFRYSAITFNGHRIHYDQDYARSVEGYPDLVVHGPLQASLMLQYGGRLGNGRRLKSFRYRGLRPLFMGEPLMLNARETDDGFELWTSDSSPAPNMLGRLVLE
ncbi:hypothetical protein A9Q96_11980 [Rhodobacterales bacterium 52_120_T64]|nr:hypothetical protein A9Q96_11980 [Rhodobacterales bacterium 52_120_T64]